MKMTPLKSAAMAFALLLPVACSFAQEPVPAPSATPAPTVAPGGKAPGDAAAPGVDRMEQFRQRINDMLKTSLKVSDEEWAIIQPLLEKVQSKQRDTLAGRFGALMGGRRGGDRGGQPAGNRPDHPDRPASAETDALKAALDSDATSPADIKAKLEALRAVRKKAAAELDQAREDLRKVLTQRQEATLVMMGFLE